MCSVPSCVKTEEVISEAMETHKKLKDVQRKISELGEALSKIIQERRRGTRERHPNLTAKHFWERPGHG